MSQPKLDMNRLDFNLDFLEKAFENENNMYYTKYLSVPIKRTILNISQLYILNKCKTILAKVQFNLVGAQLISK